MVNKNKIITEFMGFNTYEDGIIIGGIESVGFPEYEKSYENLMVVIEKIGRIDDGRFVPNINKQKCFITDKIINDTINLNFQHDKENLKLSIYNMIYKFIDWYNKKPTSSLFKEKLISEYIERANEYIDCGNSREKAFGHGMMEIINEIKDII